MHLGKGLNNSTHFPVRSVPTSRWGLLPYLPKKDKTLLFYVVM
ncbi:MAG: hypothetical protein MjAS7_0126 [Metallosphaera javensis (ex Sakai et al. 2022)]|nr:MAG: hypothetical protein MjAS7_0126 [Metallosphaera javensis (ex Sakai et al. 2022)]